MTVKKELPFWQIKSLSEMSSEEWGAVCDGCAKCCLHKIVGEDSDEISYSNVACSQLNIKSCRCKNYAQRTVIVTDCIELTKEKLASLNWLPKSCAYRLLNEGKSLKWWHPLVSGNSDTVHLAGISVRGRCIPETDISDIEDHIVMWPNEE
jgi:hypothetical protein